MERERGNMAAFFFRNGPNNKKTLIKELEIPHMICSPTRGIFQECHGAVGARVSLRRVQPLRRLGAGAGPSDHKPRRRASWQREGFLPGNDRVARMRRYIVSDGVDSSWGRTKGGDGFWSLDFGVWSLEFGVLLLGSLDRVFHIKYLYM